MFLRRLPLYGSACLFATALLRDKDRDIALDRYGLFPSTTIERPVSRRLWDLRTENGSPCHLQVDGMDAHTPVYTDRDYRFSRIPDAFRDAVHIATANEDKFSRGRRFLSFRVNAPVEVFIGHDERFMERAPGERFPHWLVDDPGVELVRLLERHPWRVAESVPVLIEGREAYRLRFYRLAFEAGVVRLGGNHPDGPVANFSMYSVFVKFR